MRVLFSIWILALAFIQANAIAQEPETLAEAKSLATSSGRPILMEFLRSG